MAINWGVLAPIQPNRPQVVAQGTSTTSSGGGPSVADDLGRGLAGLGDAIRQGKKDQLAERAADQDYQMNNMKMDAYRQEQATKQQELQKAEQERQDLAKIGSGTKDNTQYQMAVIDFYKKQGRPDLATKYIEGSEKIKEATIKNQAEFEKMSGEKQKNSFEAFKLAGGMATNMIASGEDNYAVQQYRSQYGNMYMKLNPQHAPDPKNASDQEIIAYLHGASDSYLDWNNIMKDNPELLKNINPKLSKQLATQNKENKKPTSVMEAENYADLKKKAESGDKNARDQLEFINRGNDKKPSLQQSSEYVLGLEQRAAQGDQAAAKELEIAKSQMKNDQPWYARFGNAVGNMLPSNGESTSSRVKVFNPKTGRLE